ncbi:MAG: sigma-70 domain-containing protein [Candidatus Thorarchaeota archaeon]
MNPIDEALELLSFKDFDKQAFAKQKLFQTQPIAQRAEKELQMWHDWNNSGRQPEKIRPLIHSLQPLIRNRSKIFENKIRDIPPAVINSEFQRQVVNALETFDPNRNVKMSTYITKRLKKANRFITTYQNPARIIETRVYNITKIRNAEDILQQKYGRPPTAHEIADYTQMPVNDVQTLQTEVRRTFPIGQFGASDPAVFTPSRSKEIMKLLPYDLTPEENSVFEYIHGIGGKPMLGTGDIAKKLNISAPKVSRLKKSIADKWSTYE